MKVVSNSGPLINLAKVGQFTLLQDLFQHITIPPAVFEEVVIRGGSQPGAGETSTAQWITRGMLEPLARGTWIAPAIYAEVVKLSQEIKRARERRRRSG